MYLSRRIKRIKQRIIAHNTAHTPHIANVCGVRRVHCSCACYAPLRRGLEPTATSFRSADLAAGLVGQKRRNRSSNHACLYRYKNYGSMHLFIPSLQSPTTKWKMTRCPLTHARKSFKLSRSPTNSILTHEPLQTDVCVLFLRPSTRSTFERRWDGASACPRL